MKLYALVIITAFMDEKNSSRSLKYFRRKLMFHKLLSLGFLSRTSRDSECMLLTDFKEKKIALISKKVHFQKILDILSAWDLSKKSYVNS